MSKSALSHLAFELSQERLSSQMTSALAADARAMGYAGIMIAAAAVLTGLSTATNAPGFMIAGAVLLIISAALAGYSARPVPFYMPGAKFSDLLEDIQKERDKDDALLELGRFNDENSEANDRVMRANSRTMRLAFLVALVGILVATAPQIASLDDAPPAATTPSS